MSSVSSVIASMKVDFGTSDAAINNLIASLAKIGAQASQTASQVQAAGASLSASFNQGGVSAANLTGEFNRLIAVIREESAAASLADQRNLAMARSMNTFGQSAQHGGLNLRYLIFGLKDIAEGRSTFALAEMVNVLSRLGPAAITGGAALGAIGGLVYVLTELKNKIQNAKDASDQAFGAILRPIQLTSDNLDVTNEKLKNEIALLEHTPVNRSAEAIAELRAQADKAEDSLLTLLGTLEETLEKQKSGNPFTRFFTNEPSTQPLIDYLKNARRDVGKLEDQRQAALQGKTGNDVTKVNEDYKKQIDDKVKYYQDKVNQAVLELNPFGNNERYEKQVADVTKSLSILKTNSGKESAELALQQHKQHDEDSKKGIEDARSLSVAQIEARQKSLQEQTELAKRASEAQIAADHAVVQAQIAGMVDRKAASTAEAAEALRIARATESAITADQKANTQQRITNIEALGAAEKIGKTGTEQATIDVNTESKLQELLISQQLTKEAAELATKEKETALHVKEITEARERDLEALAAIGKKMDDDIVRAELYRDLAVQLKEIREKGSGNEAELRATGQKLEAERQYATLLSHSGKQQIAHLDQIAAIEKQGRDQKLLSLVAARDTAQGIVDSPYSSGVSDEERKRQAVIAADLQVKINEQILTSANAELTVQMQKEAAIRKQNDLLQAQTEIAQTLTNWSQISLGTVVQQFSTQLLALPEQLSDSFAEALFSKPKRGERNKAGEIGKSLLQTTEKAGEQLTGKLLTDAIQKGISKVIGKDVFASVEVAELKTHTKQLADIIAALQKIAQSGGLAPTAPNGTTPTQQVGTLPGVRLGGQTIESPPSEESDTAEEKSNNATSGGLGPLFKTIYQPTPVSQNQGAAGTGGGQPGFQQISAGLAGTTAALGALSQITGQHSIVTQLLHVAMIANTAATVINTIATLIPKPFGFAAGGHPDPSKPFIAGENGPELIHPKGYDLNVIPHGKTAALFQNTSKAFSSSSIANNHSSIVGDINFHAHGVQDVRGFLRESASAIKQQTRQSSPFNS